MRKFILFFVIVIGIILHTNKKINICNKELTDDEYEYNQHHNEYSKR